MMAKGKYLYKYLHESFGEGFADARVFRCGWPELCDGDEGFSRMAEVAAADYYAEDDDHSMDGWPIEITLFSMEGKNLGRFHVERQDFPTFSAGPI